MAKEFRQHSLGLIGLLTCALIAYGLIRAGSSTVAAHLSSPAKAEMTQADQHLYAAVYTTTGGYSSVLGLNNAQNHPITVWITLYNRHGAAVTVPPITLDGHGNKVFDVADWVGNANGFEQGSLEVFYHDVSMALGAQETITDRNHNLSFDVHLQERTEFMSERVDGLWWALDDNQTEAQVFIANTRAAQTVFIPTFYVGGAAQQGDSITLNGRESGVIDIKKSLQKLRVPIAATGGVSFAYNNGPGALATVGVIRNKHTGFSTTMRFIDQASQMGTHLHGANILIGKPAPDLGFAPSLLFTPHVIVRNNTDQPVQINSRIRYTSNDQPNKLDLPTLTLTPNAVSELDLVSGVEVLGNKPLSAYGIEIDHNGKPGAVIAYAASVDQGGNTVVDVPVKDPTSEMGFKGGSYPWNIAGDNRAVLDVKSVDVPGNGLTCQFMVKLYFDSGEYYVPLQQVDAGQTATIDIKKLRDDQVPDSLGNLIPLDVTGGQLNWYGRAKHGDFIGGLVQYDPVSGISASFSCVEPCQCGPTFGTGWLSPDSHDGEVGDVFHIDAWEEDVDCQGWPFIPYRVPGANFYTTDPFVVDVFQNTAYVVGPGNADIYAEWGTYIVTERPDPNCETGDPNDPCPVICDNQEATASGTTEVRIPKVRITSSNANGYIDSTTQKGMLGATVPLHASVITGAQSGGVFEWKIDGVVTGGNSADLSVVINTLGNHSVSVKYMTPRGGRSTASLTLNEFVPEIDVTPSGSSYSGQFHQTRVRTGSNCKDSLFDPNFYIITGCPFMGFPGMDMEAFVNDHPGTYISNPSESHLKLVQIVNVLFRKTNVSTGVCQQLKTTGWMLDGMDPAATGEVHSSGSGANVQLFDTPNAALVNGFNYTDNTSFETYLVYYTGTSAQPQNQKAIAVLAWSYGASSLFNSSDGSHTAVTGSLSPEDGHLFLADKLTPTNNGTGIRSYDTTPFQSIDVNNAANYEACH